MDCVVCDSSATFQANCCKQPICLQCVLKLQHKACVACRCSTYQIQDQDGKIFDVPNTRGYVQDDIGAPPIFMCLRCAQSTYNLMVCTTCQSKESAHLSKIDMVYQTFKKMHQLRFQHHSEKNKNIKEKSHASCY